MMIKKIVFFIAFPLMSLVSCNPGSGEIGKDVNALITLNASSYTYNLHPVATEYRDPIQLEIFLEGSSTPANMNQLMGVDGIKGEVWAYYLAYTFDKNLYHVVGSQESHKIHQGFDVGWVLDAGTLLVNGGINLKEKGIVTGKDRMTLTLYRIDLTMKGFTFTQVSDSVTVDIYAVNETPKLDATPIVAQDSREKILHSNGSDSFSFIVGNFSLDDNALGKANQERLLIEQAFYRESGYLQPFDVEVDVLADGNRRVTVKASGVPAGRRYNLPVDLYLGQDSEIHRSNIVEFFITVK